MKDGNGQTVIGHEVDFECSSRTTHLYRRGILLLL